MEGDRFPQHALSLHEGHWPDVLPVELEQIEDVVVDRDGTLPGPPGIADLHPLLKGSPTVSSHDGVAA